MFRIVGNKHWNNIYNNIVRLWEAVCAAWNPRIKKMICTRYKSSCNTPKTSWEEVEHQKNEQNQKNPTVFASYHTLCRWSKISVLYGTQYLFMYLSKIRLLLHKRELTMTASATPMILIILVFLEPPSIQPRYYKVPLSIAKHWL